MADRKLSASTELATEPADNDALMVLDVSDTTDGAGGTNKKTLWSTIKGLWTRHSLATAVNDFLVGSGAGEFVKKTLAETKIILGIPYVHPNHSGDVTSVADGAQTIANGAVSLAKMADMATASLLGRNTAGSGAPEVLSAATVRTLLSLVVGANVQAYDADLTTWAGLTPSANAQSLVTAADYAAMRTLLGLVIGTNVQAYDAELAALAGLTSAANKSPYFTGSGTAALADLSAFARTLIDDADAAEARVTLGIVNPGLQACRVYNNANISIPDNTETILTFNSERRDDGGFHSTSTNTSRLTAPVTGWYIITGAAQFQSSATGRRYAFIRLNGTTDIVKHEWGTASTTTNATIQTIHYLTAGDYVEFGVFQSSGGSLNVVVGGNFSPEFGMALIASGGDLVASNNLSDLANAATARTNLGLSANGSSLVTAADYAAMLTLLFGIALPENTAIQLDTALSADGKYSGIVEAGTAGAALAFGDLVYLATADSRWELVDANAAATCSNKLGICVLAAAGDGSATTILLYGKVRADAVFPALTIGAPVFAGTTAGDVQTTAPSGAADIIRIIGYGNTADELFFHPSNDYFEHT